MVMWQTANEAKVQRRGQSHTPGCQWCPGEKKHRARAVFSPALAQPDPVWNSMPAPSLEETSMDDGSRMRLLVVLRGPIGESTGVLPDSWCRVVCPFAPSVRVLLHERQRIQVNQSPE
jgi:hypothetical protein